ncbi:acetyl-CoA carboxylase biotin carboxylase subunit [Pelistega europaea]|uniref:Acetyl/propionyl/methylcrotonyl-CoA carboxylase subunit alpha n=1 Tax=Pelistega europaea TaxID=106147 RepID=A0A7Y4L7W2_9BURK|nr:acetyl/propionyl/methylcrotonyl-CoA carboxylase subunit alpha [Pelistega europaea]NOL48605.1 acetyl/propionyl/methylcrotonyl-CoA carboxylase subunit alpha [Pelistega europaea]
MFTKILIANRGEIACRVAATARKMGIRTVAVYSDADANAAHVAACDESVYIGGSEPRQSYLRADIILEAAKRTGAQAIHPGYGFLSENEAFAQACADNGIVFIGPPASSISAMGSKSAAKALMEKAGVPLVPGYHGDNQDPDFLQQEANRIGYPVLIKASAGGGGKGMRIVPSEADFKEALSSCKREAINSFGDDKVLVERYLSKPRHIEIQVFADSHGNAVYLFERDCSVQRRHQKVIEEAPAPGMTAERRQQMGEAAVAAAKAVGYVGAGTVEFIAEPDGRFYFMEMNTRLQVEHPVTEMITGYDLVEWQLRVAAGEALPARQEDLRIHGHAIESRIYAENPDNGFLPSIGQLQFFRLPEHVKFERSGAIRVDGGVRQGDTISPFYDPMIAKLIVWGEDREQAIARMQQALAETQVVGVSTNVAFLGRLFANKAFTSADLDTGLIEKNSEQLLPKAQPATTTVVAHLIAALLAQRGQLSATKHTHQQAADPWDFNDTWRVASVFNESIHLQDGDECRTVLLQRVGGDWTFTLGEQTLPFVWKVEIDGGRFITHITLDGVNSMMSVVLTGENAYVFDQGKVTHLQLPDDLHHSADEQDHGGSLVAPMPGKIISLAVSAGDIVKAGQTLLVMEAMKMEHTITSPKDGRVEEIFYAVGDQVTDGVELIKLGE